MGCHFANYREAWEANELIARRRGPPDPLEDLPLTEAGRAADDVYDNVHLGKVGVLCMAPEAGLGVVDHELREQHLDGDHAVPGLSAGSDALQHGRAVAGRECGRIVHVTPARARMITLRARTVAALVPQRTR